MYYRKKNMFSKNIKITEYIYQFEDISIKVQPKDIKNIYLKITNIPEICLSIPKREYVKENNVSKKVHIFLEDKYEWIKLSYIKMLNKIKNNIKLDNYYLDNKEELSDTIKILGTKYKIIYNININKNKITYKDLVNCNLKEIYIYDNYDKIKQLNILKKRFKIEFLKYITPLIKKWEIITQKEFVTIKINNPKGNWGSCNKAKQLLNLNIDLIYKDLADIEYVIVHEFCHLFEANHSNRFYEYMDKFMPDWKKRKKNLNN